MRTQVLRDAHLRGRIGFERYPHGETVHVIRKNRLTLLPSAFALAAHTNVLHPGQVDAERVTVVVRL